MTRWSIVMVCIVALAVVQLLRMGMRQSQTFVFHDVAVEQTGEYEYWLVPEDGHERFHTTICRDYAAPQFRTGMILSKVIFVDHGGCWSLDPNQHAGYFIRRNPYGIPIYVEPNAQKGALNGQPVVLAKQ